MFEWIKICPIAINEPEVFKHMLNDRYKMATLYQNMISLIQIVYMYGYLLSYLNYLDYGSMFRWQNKQKFVILFYNLSIEPIRPYQLGL